jgi:hypothetical protein
MKDLQPAESSDEEEGPTSATTPESDDGEVGDA